MEEGKQPETCVWRRGFLMGKDGYGDGWTAGCCSQSWFDHAASRMHFCPSCGKVVAFEAKEPKKEN
jgi:hypothetical protein